MTTQSILNLATSLNQVGQLKGVKFAYAVARNLNLLKPELKKFEESRIALLKSCVELDDKGEIKRKGEKEPIWKDKKIWEEEYKKLIDEEVKLDLFKIGLADIPPEITAQQLSGIFEIIEEETPKK